MQLSALALCSLGLDVSSSRVREVTSIARLKYTQGFLTIRRHMYHVDRRETSCTLVQSQFTIFTSDSISGSGSRHASSDTLPPPICGRVRTPERRRQRS
jgi:hypothetical protein